MFVVEVTVQKDSVFGSLPVLWIWWKSAVEIIVLHTHTKQSLMLFSALRTL